MTVTSRFSHECPSEHSHNPAFADGIDYEEPFSCAQTKQHAACTIRYPGELL